MESFKHYSMVFGVPGVYRTTRPVDTYKTVYCTGPNLTTFPAIARTTIPAGSTVVRTILGSCLMYVWDREESTTIRSDQLYTRYIEPIGVRVDDEDLNNCVCRSFRDAYTIYIPGKITKSNDFDPSIFRKKAGLYSYHEPKID